MKQDFIISEREKSQAGLSFSERAHNKGEAFIFDNAFGFKDGKAAVKLGEHWGEIDTRGECVTEIKHEYLKRVDKNRLAIRVGGKWGVIDGQKNVIIPFQYNSLDPHGENHFIAELNGKCGVIDANGNVVIDFGKYYLLQNARGCGAEYLCAFLESDEWVRFKAGEFKGKYIKEEDKGNYGLVDLMGNATVPFEYNDLCINNCVAVVKKNGKYGAVNLQNKVIAPFEYKKLRHLSDKTLVAERESGKDIIIDFSNKRVCEKEFDYIGTSRESLDVALYSAKIDGKYGFIDQFGNTKIDFKYRSAGTFSTLHGSDNPTSTFCAVSKDGEHWGLIDQDDNLIIPFEYNSCIFQLHKDVIGAEKNGKCGLIDWNNNVVADFAYDKLQHFNDGFAPAKLDRKWGFIDKQGRALEVSPKVQAIGLKVSQKEIL